MRVVVALLPLSAFVVCWLAAAGWARGWRLGFAYAFLVVSSVALLATEALSLLSGISAGSVAILYVLLLVASVAVLARRGWPPPPLPSLSRAHATWALILGGQFLVLLVLALAAVPNTADSMFYHMARVAHWASSGSLDHYATAITPQLYFAPLAEIGVLHLQLLTGSDRLANLVQLLAHAVCIAASSLIAKNLRLGVNAQLAAAVATATIPMAVAQAVTTQNDYLTAAYLVSAVAIGTSSSGRVVTWKIAIPTAVAFGLALATKATAALFGLPLALWLGWRLFRTRPRRELFIATAGAVLAVALLNVGHVTRNIQTFGDPLGPDTPALRVEEVTVQTSVGNLIRNAGHNLAVPALHEANVQMATGLSGVMRALRIDPHEPSALFSAARFDMDSARNEDRASSTPHWLLLIATCFALANRRLRKEVGGLMVALILGYVLFSIVLKWQPWGARLLLPLLVLGSVPVAALTSRAPKVAMHGALAAMMLFSLPWLLVSQYRPLLGGNSVLVRSPTEVMFYNQPALQEPYTRATAYIATLGVKRVGLVTKISDWEYPLWRLLAQRGPVEIVQVDVQNETARMETRSRPSVVICVCRRAAPPGYDVTVFGPIQVEQKS